MVDGFAIRTNKKTNNTIAKSFFSLQKNKEKDKKEFHWSKSLCDKALFDKN
jgi:hypothetical protein